MWNIEVKIKPAKGMFWADVPKVEVKCEMGTEEQTAIAVGRECITAGNPVVEVRWNYKGIEQGHYIDGSKLLQE